MSTSTLQDYITMTGGGPKKPMAPAQAATAAPSPAAMPAPGPVQAPVAQPPAPVAEPVIPVMPQASAVIPVEPMRPAAVPTCPLPEVGDEDTLDSPVVQDGVVVDDAGGCVYTEEEAVPLPQPVGVISAPQPAAQVSHADGGNGGGLDFLAAMGGADPVAQPAVLSAPAVVQPEPAPAAQAAPVVKAPPAMEAASVPLAPPPAVAIAAPGVAQAMVAAPVVQAPAPPAAPVPTPPVVAKSATDVEDSGKLWGNIRVELNRVRNLTGIAVIENPSLCDEANVVHVAIRTMRHNPMGLVQMSPRDLCVYEAALSAHQVYVQAMEMEWSARYQFLGREIERLMRIHRANYKGDTQGAKEDEMLKAEPAMRQLRADFMMAQAISSCLTGQGDRFAQLEDGLKRTITMRQAEQDLQVKQGRWSA